MSPACKQEKSESCRFLKGCTKNTTPETALSSYESLRIYGYEESVQKGPRNTDTDRAIDDPKYPPRKTVRRKQSRKTEENKLAMTHTLIIYIRPPARGRAMGPKSNTIVAIARQFKRAIMGIIEAHILSLQTYRQSPLVKSERVGAVIQKYHPKISLDLPELRTSNSR